MIRRPPRSTQSRSSAASDVYKRQREEGLHVVGGVVVEDGRVGQPADLGAMEFRGAGFQSVIQRLTLPELLVEVLAVAPDVHVQLRGQGVDHGEAHTMETAGLLVGARLELATGERLDEDPGGGG